MSNAVLKSAGYILAHVPGMVVNNGATQTTERIVNPASDYLEQLSNHLRPYAQVLSYAPNQTFIGNMTPDELNTIPFPWYQQQALIAERFGRFGEIMPEDEFIGLMSAVDTFDLVKLEERFADAVRERLSLHRLLSGHAAKIKSGLPPADIETLISEQHAEALTFGGNAVGCVKRAHDIDINLSAHVMLENLAAKASALLAFLYMANADGADIREIDYVIECSEEACGDMNQRGGGNFAKAIAEAAGAVNAAGSDTRAFCAAPVHALVEAASLVKAGTFKNVAVVAGGATAKLGMNGKDHVKKGLPILEDALGGFALLVGEDDGVSPVVNTACVGRHTVGGGSAPQAVITALAAAPLEARGLRISDVDKYAAELQNPDITKPAGAGDVPEANYKMLAALSVMRGETERAGIPAFIEKHGMRGFAPTQGHIPSGVPFAGFAREGLMSGGLNRVMLIGKGSLFLGRMTNLFDGISVLLERNTGKPPQTDKTTAITGEREVYRIGLTLGGSEHGDGELIKGAAAALAQNDAVTAVLIGNNAPGILPERAEFIQAEEPHREMERLLDNKELDACVTMHYNFPVGVSTVGCAVTPGYGRHMLIATTTGVTDTNRVNAMVKNAVYGIAAAKAVGIAAPSVGVLNIDGAVQAERALRALRKNGYEFNFSASGRADGGALMRGNDALSGAADVMVTDTLTGNVMMKMLSSFNTGGGYESLGGGYGPGLGENYNRLVLILSRASGAPVAAGAILYAARLVKGRVRERVREELSAAREAGLDSLLTDGGGNAAKADIPKETVTEEITGIDVMRLDDAVKTLNDAGIYAEGGMGCTGPVALVNPARLEKALELLKPFLESV